MKRSSLGATWVGALAAASAALFFQGSAARAQYSQCESNEDCGPGYVCNEGSFQSCDGGWTCDDEGNCTEEPGECTTYESNWCSNATCEADADCPSYMACQTQTQWVCDVGAAGAGGTAGTGAGGAAGTFAGMGGFPGGSGGDGASCHEEPAPSLCIARHQLPCEEASDCGAGFDCVESYYYECNGGSAGAAGMVAGAGGTGGGGGSAGGMTGGSGGSDEPGECHEVPSGTSYCSLQNLPCESDAECAEGLSCEPYYEYPDCVFIPGGEGGSAGGVAGTGSAGMGAGGAGGGAGGEVGGAGGEVGGAGGEAGGGEDPGGYWECPPPVETHRCQPIAPPGGGGAGMGGGSAGEGGTSGGGEAGAAGMSTDPGSGSGGAGSGAGDDDGESDEHRPGHGRGRGLGLLKKLLGCSAGGPASGNASMGWLMLGLAAVVLGRRTRRN